GPGPESVELGLPADARQGALAVAAGEALWRSAETGETITIDLD
ncbi:MAG TPA: polyketide cyclase, partial [Candidatus Avipropionibacterium avicola]|nr:polyketide cyclase [Candidatus Avipropionibacterium avicola]